MNRKPNTQVATAELHRRAKARLQERQANQRSAAGTSKSEAASRGLLHELQVHQVELELQNAELQKARDELEVALEKYTDLYDFAPVGYFSLADDGRIHQVNLTGAHLVGIERSRLVGQSFGPLVSAEFRPAFNSFLKRIFADQTKQTGDLELLRKGQPPRAVNVEAQRLLNAKECRVVVTDITQRKRAEQHLRRTLRFDKAVMTNMGEGLYTVDTQGLVTYMNPAAEKLLGWKLEELRGRKMHDLTHHHRPEGTPFPAEKCAKLQALKQGVKLTRKEDCLIRKDGTFFDVVYSASPLKSDGEISGMVAVLHDVSERKRTEDKLRVSEVRYRRLFEAAHNGVLILDAATRKITDANPFMTRLLGYPRDKLIGKELFEIGLLKDEAANQEMFRKLKRKHEVRYEDLPLESQGGRHREVEVVANLYQENEHRVIQCNIRDITERKQAEEMLRRNEALFAALIAQSPVAVCIVDARLRLQHVNLKARPVFKKIRPLIGRDFSEIIHGFWPKRVANQILERFRHTLKTGAPYQSLNFTERRRDIGVKEFYEWRIHRVTLPDGEHGVVCFFDNITARKRAEATQRRMDVLTASNRKLEQEIVRRQTVEKSLKKSEQHQNKLLEQSRKMQGQLRQLSRQILTAQEEERKAISRELHDVVAQTLTGINVQLAALKREAVFSPRGLDRSIAHTQRLVEESVDVVHQFARELRPAVLDDLGLIPALHSFMKHFTAQTGVRTRLTAIAEVNQLDAVQRTVLFRVAQEAFTNVARHAQASRVEVSIQKRQHRICMKIEDDGKSFRVERTSHATNGKRLGLLGMRERLEMVGGCFEVESAPGRGTTIEAQIPLGKVRAASVDGR